MKFIILVKEIAIAEHLVSIFNKLGLDNYSVITSIKSAREMVKEKIVNCIIFDSAFSREGYQSFVNYFLESYICFVPIQHNWSNEEVIEAINAGMAFVLTYDCTENKINECIISIEARL